MCVCELCMTSVTSSVYKCQLLVILASTVMGHFSNGSGVWQCGGVCIIVGHEECHWEAEWHGTEWTSDHHHWGSWARERRTSQAQVTSLGCVFAVSCFEDGLINFTEWLPYYGCFWLRRWLWWPKSRVALVLLLTGCSDFRPFRPTSCHILAGMPVVPVSVSPWSVLWYHWGMAYLCKIGPKHAICRWKV